MYSQRSIEYTISELFCEFGICTRVGLINESYKLDILKKQGIRNINLDANIVQLTLLI